MVAKFLNCLKLLHFLIQYIWVYFIVTISLSFSYAVYWIAPFPLSLLKHLFLTPQSSFRLFLLVLQRLWRGCGRSTTHPSSRWSRPTSTMSWGSTRSQVSQRLRLQLHFVLMCGFFCLGCFGDWFVDLFVDTQALRHKNSNGTCIHI